jgi:hypothetical protein
MDNWNSQRYEQEKRSFIQRRIHQAPLWGQFTLLFGMSWGAAWLCSWFLLRFVADAQPWARSLPMRYAVAFLFAYACFFLAVKAWIGIAKHEPEKQYGQMDWADGGTWGGDGEGCLIVLVVLLVGFIAGGIFLFAGGAPMLLEAAFEAAFAGVVVRRPLSGDIVLGGWKMHLLKSTWKQALIGIVLLVTLAAWLQQQAPQATTFADALRAVSAMR